MNERVVKCNNSALKVYVRDEADESVCNEIFVHHEYRHAEEMIKNATSAILDVGAHSGLFSLYARALNPTARIVAIEPEKKNRELFKKHLAENNIQNVELAAVALGQTTEKRRLLLNADSHNHRLIKKTDPKDVAKGGKTQDIECYTFGDFCKKYAIDSISLLKMDIEGGEYEVFAGMTADDFKKIQSVIMEYHTTRQEGYHTIEQKLRENGFGVEVFPSKFDKTMGFLWARNKRV